MHTPSFRAWMNLVPSCRPWHYLLSRRRLKRQKKVSTLHRSMYARTHYEMTRLVHLTTTNQASMDAAIILRICIGRRGRKLCAQCTRSGGCVRVCVVLAPRLSTCQSLLLLLLLLLVLLVVPRYQYVCPLNRCFASSKIDYRKVSGQALYGSSDCTTTCCNSQLRGYFVNSTRNFVKAYSFQPSLLTLISG